ncbi:MAG: MFS transporter [Planctomycetes bacterium]|nr:MFS transporter [Planctomycetota bacterium]
MPGTSDSQPVGPSETRSVGPLALRSYYFFFFAVVGCSIPFINLFFEKTLHFSGKQIGSITAVRLMMAVVVPPIWGILSDKLRGPRFLMAIGLGTSAVALILFGAVALYWQALLLMGIFAFFNTPVFPLIDSVTFGYLTKHPRTTYGRIRCAGSVGFIFASICMWLILSKTTNLRVAFYVAAASSVVALSLVSKLPAVKVKPRRFIAKRAVRLFLQRDLLILGLCGFIGRAAMEGYYSFFSNYLHGQGFDDRLIGLVWALGPIAETPFIFYSERLIGALGIRGVYGLGLAAIVVRLFILSLQPSAAIILMSQALHALTLGALLVGGLIYVDGRTPDDLRASAQSIFAASMLGAGGVVGSLMAGAFVDAVGVPAMMRFHSLIAAAAFIVFVLFFRPRPPLERE